MKLLNASTKRLEEFFDDDIPPYAILSHTWGKQEVQFKDIEEERYTGDSTKIEGCCHQAIVDGLGYVWIDTCCIDKSSSAELSEAINSMFAWYEGAQVCYAYLADVPEGDLGARDPDSAFRKSRWFTRGWTLQELLAPRRVVFYDVSWTSIGTKDSMVDEGSIHDLLSKITGIPICCFLDSHYIRQASIAIKMSWAARRRTTRVEDMAYSLLGLFGVNMPLLYGEKEKAFIRLQEAILRTSVDQSILAWGFNKPPSTRRGFLARSPSEFEYCTQVIPYTPDTHDGAAISHYSITNLGLHICMRLRHLSSGTKDYVGLLNCTTFGEGGWRNIAIPLTLQPRETGRASMTGPFDRSGSSAPMLIRLSLFDEPDNNPHVPIYLGPGPWQSKVLCGFTIESSARSEKCGLSFVEVYPLAWYPILLTEGSVSIPMAYLTEVYKEGQQTQRIYLRCFNELEESSFVVRVQYTFKYLAKNAQFIPQGLEYSAASMARGLTLAELMADFQDRIDDVFEWQQQLDMNQGILKLALEKSSEKDWLFLKVDIIKKPMCE